MRTLHAMPRRRRVTPAGYVFHVLNRAAARRTLFRADADYEAFERMLAEAVEATGMRLCAFCLMPNHWHMSLWPTAEGQISEFAHRLCRTHAVKWLRHHEPDGSGHLYQGRFKSFPVQTDESFLRVVRYVERNALRAGLVSHAEDWRWNSLWWRINRPHQAAHFLSAWPVPMPDMWVNWVNEPQHQTEIAAIRKSVTRSDPFGDPTWIERTKSACQLPSRSRGRPRKSDQVQFS